MTQTALFAIDLVAIAILSLGLYFPRHRRKDMVVAYLVANIGVLSVAYVLSSSTIAAGLGLGLFGILSIIRLRSSELDQAEVAYYFAALALGLLAGLSVGTGWTTPVLMAVILGALYVGDHPELFGSYRVNSVTLDTAHTDERTLIEDLEARLHARVYRVKVRKVDLVSDTTVVEVRYRLAQQNESDPARHIKLVGVER